jgi:PAS domain S-box-containing protein
MIRVLHVDDEVEFLDLVSFFLKREGDFEVDTTTTAESALEKMQSENYDAVVVDYSLPGMDGIELLKILRAKGLQIPFVLFTGKGKEETAVQALNCGADFYLQKGASTQLQFTELANMLRKSVQSNRSDAAAREGERFLSSVFSSIQDGISVIDKDLNILRVNQTMEDWYSHKMPLVGKKCYDAYHGGQARCDSCPSLRTIESGKSAYEVVPKTGPKGEIVGWLDLYSFPMRDSRTGELSGVIEYVRDITDRRKTELELHDALERYKELQGIIDKSPAVLVLWRPEPGSPVTFVSDSIAQFGYKREDLMSRRYVYDDIIHKDDLDRVNEEFWGLVGKGANDFRQEYRIATPSGEVRWVEDHTYVRKGSDGNPILFEGLIIDVTARKLAQEKGEELGSRLQAIVEAFPDLYFHVDAHGTILDFNAGRIADFYVPPQKFLGRKMQEVLPPDVGKMYGDAFDEVLKTGRIVAREYSLEIQGETRFFEARLAPIAKEQVLIVVRNITASKRAEEALEVANQKLNLLGQVTRHDAMNQLAVLMGWLEIAQESVTEPPVQDYIKNMRTAAETVIKQLDFTGDYQKMGVAKPEWIDVKTAFLNGIAGFSPSKLAKSVHVDGLRVYADTMFEKVFHNLADNSIRHGKKVTEIRVHYKMQGNDLLLFYEDDGVGVPADEKDRIFLRGMGTHTGFGLFMVRAILGITGITIEENGKPDHGVRFEMRVPYGSYKTGKIS